MLSDEYCKLAHFSKISTLKGQAGTPWLPSPDSTDDEVNLDRVNVLLVLFSIQVALNGLSVLGFINAKAVRRDTSVEPNDLVGDNNRRSYKES